MRCKEKRHKTPAPSCSARSHQCVSHMTFNLPQHYSQLLVQARDPNSELCNSPSLEGRRHAAGPGQCVDEAGLFTHLERVASEAPTRFQAPEQVQVRCRGSKWGGVFSLQCARKRTIVQSEEREGVRGDKSVCGEGGEESSSGMKNRTRNLLESPAATILDQSEKGVK